MTAHQVTDRPQSHDADTDTARAASEPLPFPIVGIGASAGGLAAFEAFFSGMPAEGLPGMAFVLVQHLVPDRKSLLAELVRRYTHLPVFEAEDGMPVAINCVYTIPPGQDLACLNGCLQLLEPEAPRGHRLPIDFFFLALALDQRDRAVGVVLSGTGSDGTRGLRAIKGAGGLTLVQTLASAEFDGMPRSAIATGQVDQQLAPQDMPAELMAHAARTSSHAQLGSATLLPDAESAMKKIFVLLRSGKGHDFSQYKPSTIRRRVERRMALHRIDAMGLYVKYLRQTPDEVEALFRDLLIGVTRFFRDTEVFDALEHQLIPALMARLPVGGALRIWCCGCSTGEEAYSIAMLLHEHLQASGQDTPVQIFGTDIDGQAVATARTGRYGAHIADSLTPERLARFFVPEQGGLTYRVDKRLRDMLVFSEHDVVRDPPFSRLALLSCRNLLIYMNAELQRKLIPLFHYALVPGGYLVLGNSETVGESSGFFTTLDRSLRLYQRQEAGAGPVPAAPGPWPAALTAPAALQPARAALADRRSLREVTEQALLHRWAPAAALINGDGDIYYLHGRTGMYLEPAAGVAGVNNILKMARDGLRPALAAALNKTVRTAEDVRLVGVHVTGNGAPSAVDLRIGPLGVGVAGMPEAVAYLVLFDAAAPAAAAARPEPADPTDKPRDEGRIAELARALRATENDLQAINVELESANHKLRSSNEASQAANEDLQSTNEELETSKEELQSLNEELATVNTELQSKVLALSRANNDMNNLLSGTGIATVFVDHALRILRFTPTASELINLIAGDVGRPVAHIASNLVDYDRLAADTQGVLDTLVPMQVEVQTVRGRWFTLRVQPYRTLDNVIEGAVITFVDITEVVQTRLALHKANEVMRLAVVVRDAHDAITVQDLQGNTLAWNPGAVRLYGWSEADALLMNVRERIPQSLREGALATLHQLSLAQVLQPYRTRRLARSGAVLEVSLVSTALVNETGVMYAVATTERALAEAVAE